MINNFVLKIATSSVLSEVNAKFTIMYKWERGGLLVSELVFRSGGRFSLEPDV